MSYRSILTGLLSIAVFSPALAQDEPADPALRSAHVLMLDSLLIAPVQPMDPDLSQEAKRIGALLGARLSEDNITFAIDDVPRFEAHDYTAETYVLSCPPGDYSGCALIVGQRAPSDWVVGGTLNYAPSGVLGHSEELLLTVYFVDVRGSREVVNFGVVIGGRNDDDQVIGGIASVYDKIIQGALAEVDVRGDVIDPKVQAELDSRRNEIAAASLIELERQLGGVIITPPSEIEIERLTRASLKQQFEDREVLAPWVRLSMTEGQYLRYRNTGLELGTYRRRIRGRLAQILLRVGVGGGKGPFGLHHEGRNYVGFDLAGVFHNDLEVDQFQEIRQASNSGAFVELGFGVAPFAEVSFVLGNRSAGFTYVFDQDIDGDPSSIDPIKKTAGNTVQFGGHATLVPFPLRQVRPTATLGMMGWQGKTLPVEEPFAPMSTPNMLLLQTGPGVEASAGRNLNLFVQTLFDIPLSGTFFDSFQSGTAGYLENLAEPMGNYGAGFTVQGGVQFRLGLLADPGDRVENFFEEEEEGL